MFMSFIKGILPPPPLSSPCSFVPIYIYIYIYIYVYIYIYIYIFDSLLYINY